MRDLEWEAFHPPDDIIHHNLFHPFDPLGYRIEPLIDPVFAKIPATLVNSYSSPQSLFPSISLPSLPSLLPESISTFWESKVPALPRPSIPTFSDLSQMTQSLKAGRWLSGSTTGAGGVIESSGEESASTANEQEGGRTTDGDHEELTSSASSVSEHDTTDARFTASRQIRREREEDASMVGTADASVTECMAAVTVAAYLDQKSSRFATITADTRTRFADDVSGPTSPTSGKRPGLGPRRVSSRVDRDDETDDSACESEHLFRTTEAIGVTSGTSNNNSEDKLETDTVPSPLEMERCFGMESGPTAEEKARCLGAKSDVVQEPMVRSMPISSTSFSSSSSEETESQQNKNEMAKSEGSTDQDTNGRGSNNDGDNSNRSSDDSATDGNKQDQRQRTVHVEGRATKLPYRIDHVLQETTADQYTNEYLVSMRSHFKYWGNR
jgi:hypothetical protein